MVRSRVGEQSKLNALLCYSLELITNYVRFKICRLMCTIMFSAQTYALTVQ